MSLHLIDLRARVLLYSEEKLDQLLLREKGELENSEFVAWRWRCFPVYEIKDLVQYDREKSIVVKHNGEEFLVKQPGYREIRDKWEAYLATKAAQVEEVIEEAEPDIDFNLDFQEGDKEE